jgi:hypothetical protein
MKSQSQAFAWMQPGRCPPAAIIAHNAAHMAMAALLAAPDPHSRSGDTGSDPDRLSDRADQLANINTWRERLGARPSTDRGGFSRACARLKAIEHTLSGVL